MVTSTQTVKDLIGLSVVYFVTRLTFLTRYPIFNDESTYLRYGQVMTNVPMHQWYSLAHTGKQPLLYWLYGLMMKVIVDPLLAGRLVTVIFGVSTVLALYELGKLLDSRRTGIIAGILVIVTPLFVFFDRLALVDSTLGALFSWILVFLVRFQKRQTVLEVFFIALLVGISFWIKSTGFLFTLLAGIGLVYIWIRKARNFPIFPSLFVYILTVIAVALPLFLRPEAQRIFEMSHDYSYTFVEVFTNGFRHVPGNFINTLLVYGAYVSPIIVFASLFSFRERIHLHREVVGFLWAISLFVIIVFGKGVHGRYLVFTGVPLILFASFYLTKKTVLTIFTVLSMGALSLLLIINPPSFFHLYPSWKVLGFESYQYVDGWPSGYGFREAMDSIDRDRNGLPAVLTVRWDTGNPEDAAFVYTRGNPSLVTHYLDRALPQEAREVLYAALSTKTYFLTRKGQYGGFEKILDPLATFPKPRGTEQIELFRVRGL